METTTFNAILASLQEVSDSYLNAPAAQPDRKALDRWRPATSTWQKMQAISGWVPGIQAESIEIDGHCIRHWRISSGHGTPVVLLHGFGASKENWLSRFPPSAVLTETRVRRSPGVASRPGAKSGAPRSVSVPRSLRASVL